MDRRDIGQDDGVHSYSTQELGTSNPNRQNLETQTQTQRQPPKDTNHVNNSTCNDATNNRPTQANIVFPPTRPNIPRQTPSIILFGPISHSTDASWREALSKSLAHLPITILNPHNSAWDSSWIEDISFPPFREQVQWELDHAQLASLIAFHFGPDTLAPISLLELGMYAASMPHKVVLYCHGAYTKRGNVQMVCQRYGVECFHDQENWEAEIRSRLKILFALNEWVGKKISQAGQEGSKLSTRHDLNTSHSRLFNHPAESES